MSDLMRLPEKDRPGTGPHDLAVDAWIDRETGDVTYVARGAIPATPEQREALNRLIARMGWGKQAGIG